MKKEKRYYQIRIDYFWLSILAVIIVISMIIAYYASAHEQASSQPVSTKHRADIDVTFDDLRSSLENTSECYLCGNAEESLMSYFRNFDTIGLIVFYVKLSVLKSTFSYIHCLCLLKFSPSPMFATIGLLWLLLASRRSLLLTDFILCFHPLTRPPLVPHVSFSPHICHIYYS